MKIWIYTMLNLIFTLSLSSFSLYFNSSDYPTPHAFTTKGLRSDVTIFDIITEVGNLLPQLSNFISQFDTTVAESGVNVITDTDGTMTIDVPNSMSNAEARRISTKLNIIDNLITTRGQQIGDLLKQGLALESKLKSENSGYVSQLSDQIQELRKLNSSYKH